MALLTADSSEHQLGGVQPLGCWYLVTDLHIWTSKVHNCRDRPLQHLFLTTHNRLCWPRLFGCCRYLPWLVATGAGLPFPLPATTSDHSTHGKHPRETWKDHLRNPSLGLILLPKKEKGKKGCLLGRVKRKDCICTTQDNVQFHQPQPGLFGLYRGILSCLYNSV